MESFHTLVIFSILSDLSQLFEIQPFSWLLCSTFLIFNGHLNKISIIKALVRAWRESVENERIFKTRFSKNLTRTSKDIEKVWKNLENLSTSKTVFMFQDWKTKLIWRAELFNQVKILTASESLINSFFPNETVSTKSPRTWRNSTSFQPPENWDNFQETLFFKNPQKQFYFFSRISIINRSQSQSRFQIGQ